MFPLLDLIATVGGLVVAPLFDIIKKKFIPSSADTPERTISSLATTSPEVLPEYVKGLASMKEIAIKFFNRDVIGTPGQWVINLRAAIRPIGVILALSTLISMAVLTILGYMPELTADGSAMLTGVRASSELMVSSWFGHRISLSK